MWRLAEGGPVGPQEVELRQSGCSGQLAQQQRLMIPLTQNVACDQQTAVRGGPGHASVDVERVDYRPADVVVGRPGSDGISSFVNLGSNSSRIAK